MVNSLAIAQLAISTCNLRLSCLHLYETQEALDHNMILANFLSRLYYRKRGSASYIVREVLSVRERERYRERERERDGSDVTIVALKLAMNTLSLSKNSHNWR